MKELVSLHFGPQTLWVFRSTVKSFMEIDTAKSQQVIQKTNLVPNNFATYAADKLRIQNITKTDLYGPPKAGQRARAADCHDGSAIQKKRDL